MPQRTSRAQFAQQLRHAGEKPRVLADFLAVELEERFAQSGIFGIVGLDAESRVHEAARARGGERAQPLDGNRLLALFGAHAVYRRSEIRRRIGERAVEIEQHRAVSHARNAAGN